MAVRHDKAGDIRRINLCFDISDPRQKSVYDYLSGLKKQKTETVVALCLAKMCKSDNPSDTQLSLILAKLDALQHKLDGGLARPQTNLMANAHDNTGADIPDDGMSDEAFEDMMALMDV